MKNFSDALPQKKNRVHSMVIFEGVGGAASPANLDTHSQEVNKKFEVFSQKLRIGSAEDSTFAYSTVITGGNDMYNRPYKPL